MKSKTDHLLLQLRGAIVPPCPPPRFLRQRRGWEGRTEALERGSRQAASGPRASQLQLGQGSDDFALWGPKRPPDWRGPRPGDGAGWAAVCLQLGDTPTVSARVAWLYPLLGLYVPRLAIIKHPPSPPERSCFLHRCTSPCPTPSFPTEGRRSVSDNGGTKQRKAPISVTSKLLSATL